MAQINLTLTHEEVLQVLPGPRAEALRKVARQKFDPCMAPSGRCGKFTNE